MDYTSNKANDDLLYTDKLFKSLRVLGTKGLRLQNEVRGPSRVYPSSSNSKISYKREERTTNNISGALKVLMNVWNGSLTYACKYQERVAGFFECVCVRAYVRASERTCVRVCLPA